MAKYKCRRRGGSLICKNSSIEGLSIMAANDYQAMQRLLASVGLEVVKANVDLKTAFIKKISEVNTRLYLNRRRCREDMHIAHIHTAEGLTHVVSYGEASIRFDPETEDLQH